MAQRNDPAANLARTIKQLRDLRGLTQKRLAEQAGVPRPTVAHLESGSGNPTLAVVVKVAAALQVSIEELISPPRAQARLYPASELVTRRRGAVSVRQLLPDSLPGVVVERMDLPRGASMTGVPHKPGTREYLTCERGRVQLTASGALYELGPGDVVVFRGDQKHGYSSLGDEDAVAYSVVITGARE